MYNIHSHMYILLICTCVFLSGTYLEQVRIFNTISAEFDFRLLFVNMIYMYTPIVQNLKKVRYSRSLARPYMKKKTRGIFKKYNSFDSRQEKLSKFNVILK